MSFRGHDDNDDNDDHANADDDDDDDGAGNVDGNAIMTLLMVN